jgi:hypothetical protein
LLEFHGEACNCISVRGILTFRNAGLKDFTNEIENADIGGWASLFGE